MKIQIVMQVLPHEIDEFERQLCIFNQSVLTHGDKLIVDVTLNLNTVDWAAAKLPKDFFVEKFAGLKKYCIGTQWCSKHIFDINEDGTCNGINDKRRNSARQYANTVDAFLWLDSDLVFPAHAINQIFSLAKKIPNKYYIVSPQLTKLWDETWDCLTHHRYLNYPYGTERKINPYYVVGVNYGDAYLRTNEKIKFAAGWFNLVSANLLSLTDIPNELGSYGLEDTYVMLCAQLMKQAKMDIQQYIIENIVVAENYKLRNNPYQKFIAYTANKDLLRAEAEAQLMGLVNKFYKKMGFDSMGPMQLRG